MKRLSLMMGMVILAGGCSQSTPEPQTPAVRDPVSQDHVDGGAIKTVVAGFTGQAAVKKGREARAKIESIASNEQASLVEILE